LALTVTWVPDGKYSRGRQCALLSLIHVHAPSTGGDVSTTSLR
jgi:hypothetical protein